MSEPPAKRGCGRPKGSKNKPGAQNVGRPYKDGRLPQPKKCSLAEVALPQSQALSLNSGSSDILHAGGTASRSVSSDVPIQVTQHFAEDGPSNIAPTAPSERSDAPAGTLMQGKLAFTSGQLKIITARPLDVINSRTSAAASELPAHCSHIDTSPISGHQSLACDHALPFEQIDMNDTERHLTDERPSNFDDSTSNLITRDDGQPVDDPACDQGRITPTHLTQSPVSATSLTLPYNQPDEGRVLAGVSVENGHRGPDNVPLSATLSPRGESWVPPRVDNPYGSDLSASSPGGDDEDDEDEDEDPEMDQEFVPWNDNGTTNVNVDSQANSPRSTMPLWLKSEYLRLCDRLVDEMKRNRSHLPTCYDHYTFYNGAENCFLAVRASYDGSAAGIFHQPRFFIWLPHLLVDKIPCPACSVAGRGGSRSVTVYLAKHGFVDSPRRVVGIDQCEYIVGYRYYCPHASCHRNYQSWSPTLLKVLPKTLLDQFTFRLTYRSGLTGGLASLLRESARVGLGTTVFRTLIQTLHYHRFDRLQCQFLEMIADQNFGSLAQCWTSRRPFGEFGDCNGYAGFIPSVQYFGRFYDMMVEEEAPQLQQIICSRPANILKHDHTFKIAKRIGRKEGVPVFAALHTFINEYNEIRGMTFTPSKTHEAWAPVLQSILPSLHAYGHSESQVVYTDNIRADRDKLLSIFPSLSAGVTPVQQSPPYEELALPPDWSTVQLTTPQQVNSQFNIIMNHHTDESPVIAAFGLQSSVDTSTGISGRAALLEIAYQKTVYLIQTCHFMQDGYVFLPYALLTFLRSSVYKKVGTDIAAKFKHLHGNCGPTTGPPFSGHVDVGTLTRARCATILGTTSTPALCTALLHRCFTEDPTICISTSWAHADLSPVFIQYATLDAFAAWAIHEALTKTSVPHTVNDSTPGATPVTMFAPDGKPLAHGIIALDRPATFHGVKVTKTQTVMVVKQVLVPSYLISPQLVEAHAPTPLSVFGPVPFTLLCSTTHLQTRPVNGEVDVDLSIPSNTLQAPPGLNEEGFEEMEPADVVESCSFLSIRDNYETEENVAEQSPTIAEQDPEADKAICSFILATMRLDLKALKLVRSCIIGDIWHLFHQFPISLHHGLRRPFVRALSAAIYLTDPRDKLAVKSVLERKGVSYICKTSK
ncbi:hypothetical protein BU15DRAFT_82048 [Melanogaster broomeanus]|nr:hypothetical protein BU15DRAFT_82048 [Melanogaster broomeanus]